MTGDIRYGCETLRQFPVKGPTHRGNLSTHSLALFPYELSVRVVRPSSLIRLQVSYDRRGQPSPPSLPDFTRKAQIRRWRLLITGAACFGYLAFNFPSASSKPSQLAEHSRIHQVTGAIGLAFEIPIIQSHDGRCDHPPWPWVDPRNDT